MYWNKRHLEGHFFNDQKDEEEEEESSQTEEPSGNALKLEWTTSEWSKCSQSCGENGTQIRTVECTLLKDDQADKEEIIPYQICIDSGMSPPAAVQSCGLTHCPSWTTQPWVPCAQAKCIATRTAFQTRDVICAVKDKALDDKYCEAVLRPRSSQTCHNRRCRGIWKVGAWSEV